MPNIFGNALNNNLFGGAFSDNIFGFGGNDNLFGNGGNDVLVGGNGNDFLNGGVGSDVMVGGTGNDIYIVDNPLDVVVEDFGEGIDEVRSFISFTLGAFGRFDIENLTLFGGATVGFGNALGNRIIGNNLANNLNGFAGNDSLFGLGGNDFLFGGLGNDLLNGGTGADTMRGEAGNDVYVVDNPGDNVIELAGIGTGIDRINSLISTNLLVGGRVNVENLSLFGTAFSGIGNGLSNVIIGNAGNNFLSGLAGNDTLIGLGGNDTLVGGTGRDVSTGGAGDDVFDYNTAADSPANVFLRDHITDFDDVGNDRIDLSGVVPGVLTYRGFLGFTGINQVRVAAAGADVIVEVNLAGNTAPEMQIQLENTSLFSMTIGDFIL
jgi:Ca2+-binding RTX toxin-like protein